MNRTDQFSDEEILQGMRNYEAVVRLCSVIQAGLNLSDPARRHFDKVIATCSALAAEARKLLEEPRVKLTDGD